MCGIFFWVVHVFTHPCLGKFEILVVEPTRTHWLKEKWRSAELLNLGTAFRPIPNRASQQGLMLCQILELLSYPFCCWYPGDSRCFTNHCWYYSHYTPWRWWFGGPKPCPQRWMFTDQQNAKAKWLCRSESETNRHTSLFWWWNPHILWKFHGQNISNSSDPCFGQIRKLMGPTKIYGWVNTYDYHLGITIHSPAGCHRLSPDDDFWRFSSWRALPQPPWHGPAVRGIKHWRWRRGPVNNNYNQTTLANYIHDVILLIFNQYWNNPMNDQHWYTHRIHGAGICANIKGVYWWDPCYHI